MPLEDSRRRQAGFSAVELLVVAAIIIIAASMALPGIMQYLQTYRVQGATEQVMAELQRARNQAIMLNANCGVVFVTEGVNTYRTIVEDGQLSSADVGAAAANRGKCLNRTDAITAGDAQVGPTRTLPENIEFSAAECKPGGGAIAPVVQSMRFNRLGQVCMPGGGGAHCPAFAGGGAANTIAFGATGVNPGTALICIVDVRRPVASGRFARLITVTSGGRVSSQEPK